MENFFTPETTLQGKFARCRVSGDLERLDFEEGSKSLTVFLKAGAQILRPTKTDPALLNHAKLLLPFFSLPAKSLATPFGDVALIWNENRFSAGVKPARGKLQLRQMSGVLVSDSTGPRRVVALLDWKNTVFAGELQISLSFQPESQSPCEALEGLVPEPWAVQWDEKVAAKQLKAKHGKPAKDRLALQAAFSRAVKAQDPRALGRSASALLAEGSTASQRFVAEQLGTAPLSPEFKERVVRGFFQVVEGDEETVLKLVSYFKNSTETVGVKDALLLAASSLASVSTPAAKASVGNTLEETALLAIKDSSSPFGQMALSAAENLGRPQSDAALKALLNHPTKEIQEKAKALLTKS
ncbi:hypothetical protein K2X33_11245 [bacterium]|nr:hypothetical protein [bacterium]